MGHTGLTLGGFMQPSAARTLIENPANIEKGLCQRFLWLAPETVTSSFKSLGKVDPKFTATIGMNVLTL